MTNPNAESPPNHPFEGNSYTPPPLPPQSPKKPNKALKIFGIVVAVIVGLAVLSAIFGGGNDTKPTPEPDPVSVYTPTTAPEQTYSDWKAGFSPVWSQVQADWNTTSVALGNEDEAGATSGFAALSQDAAQIARFTNSPDPVLNDEIQTLAYDLQAVAADGLTAINSGSDADLATFGESCDAFRADQAIVADQLVADNGSLS